MKLLFLTATPLNAIQGSGTYVGIATLKNALEKLGHSVEILTPDFWCPNFVLKRFLFNQQVPRRVRECGNADIIVGFDCDGFLLPRAAVGAHGRVPLPYLVSLKGVLADEAKQERGIIQWLLRVQSKWEMRNAKKADIAVVTSQYCKKVVQDAYRIHPGKIRVIPEMIHLQQWQTLLAAAADRQDKKGVTVLTVCRMYPRKNLGLLLRAWKRIREKEPTARLRIVGTGQKYQRWLRLSKELQLGESARFLGDKTREELAEEYKNCDIFCLPSRQEGFGIVFLEAMAAGKPIVAARAAAVPEVVRERKEGLLVSPDVPKALEDALLRLIRDHAMRLQMGKSGQDYVQRYEAVEVAKQFLNTVQSATGDKEPAYSGVGAGEEFYG
ncbi:MAG: glycosyltransferase family 4 protein [Candidatus Omnitrophica bacterium]|nr:glycosyltransferase family 4 protein [Candidatus Omnitrophota bacterium]